MNNWPLNPNIPELTNLNWVMWRISIQGYMKQHDLYSFISSNKATPTDPSAAKSFKSQRIKGSGVLQQYMGMTNYQKSESNTTQDDPREMWVKLEQH
jgi:hypothetical protein